MEKVKRIIRTLTYLRCLIGLFTALTVLFTLSLFPKQANSPFRRPSPFIIEKSLFEYINREREKRNLSPLRLSPQLNTLARKHSQDMAAKSELSHLSSKGESYDQRLVKKGFYFMDIGENVAFSETFQADFIHQSLMESREHMENILMPQFGHVGIGVIYTENKGYYITQDFIQSSPIKEAAEIKQFIRKRVNEIRHSHSLPPLAYTEEADKFALKFSKRKAEKKSKPPFPSAFGETHVISIVTPSLPEAESVFEDVINVFYKAGGLGVWLARNKDFPGGAYFITLVLFPEPQYKKMKISDQRKLIVQALNNVRVQKGLEDLILDNRLSEIADQISLLAINQKGKTIDLPPRLDRKHVISYVTEGPYMLPEGIKKQIERKRTRNIGVGMIFVKSPEYPTGVFWITLIFK